MASGDINKAAQSLLESKYTTAFTGAGISVESGIPPFRGEDGLWSKYDPQSLEIGYFMNHPKESWMVIREIFYAFFGKAHPNRAHIVLARMEQHNLLSRIITQNIDNLHQEAGSREVYEFHGNSKRLICLSCQKDYHVGEINLDQLPPLCKGCNGILKPDFVFFGEAIPQIPFTAAYEAATKSSVLLIIGTTGEVMPANQIPVLAKNNGALIIEINPKPSLYTGGITDILLQGNATEMMQKLEMLLFPATL